MSTTVTALPSVRYDRCPSRGGESDIVPNVPPYGRLIEHDQRVGVW